MIEGMNFGDAVVPADSLEPAAWIQREGDPELGRVGWLVPSRYTVLLRIYPPAPTPGDWWSLYRRLYSAVASIGARHTTTPSRAWFGIWEGHGFDTSTTHITHPGPLDETSREEIAREQQALWEEDRRRNAAVRASLDRLLKFDRPARAYYLLSGGVASVTQLRYPDDSGWRNPDLFWPDDRSWFIGTDVDFWSLYVGGTEHFIEELARNIPTRCEPVTRATALEQED